MKGIFKKENVYVVVDKDEREEIRSEEIDKLIFSSYYEYEKQNVQLYGGRVCLESAKYRDLTVMIDGIPIQHIYMVNDCFSATPYLDIYKAVAYLNQMENLGIDSFLENYKKQLQEIKKELEVKMEKMEQNQSEQIDENKSSILTSLRKVINELTCIIFYLLINMNAGLDNQSYTDAYNEIINLYF